MFKGSRLVLELIGSVLAMLATPPTWQPFIILVIALVFTAECIFLCLKKNGRVQSSLISFYKKRQRSSYFIIALFVLIVGIVYWWGIQKAFSNVQSEKKLPPRINAQAASFKTIFHKISTKRANYLVAELQDRLTGLSRNWWITACPPDVNLMNTPSEEVYSSKMAIENFGDEVAKNIKLILYKPGNSKLEVIIPHLAIATVRDFDASSQESAGKEIVIQDLKNGKPLVITTILTSTTHIEQESDRKVTGYLIYNGEYLDWIDIPLLTLMKKYHIKENMLLNSMTFRPIPKKNSYYKDKVPSNLIYVPGQENLTDVIKNIEGNKFNWEK